MSDVRVLIVDDEPVAREGLREFVDLEEGFTVCGEAESGDRALTLVRTERPDVVLLDVQMPAMDGFEVLRSLSDDERPVVVFVTAFEQYAVRAFEEHAVDYLLKPFDLDRCRTALDRARRRLHGQEGDDGAGLKKLLQSLQRRDRRWLDRFVVKQRGRIVLVSVPDVTWIEAAGNYVYIHLQDAKHLIRDSLTHLEAELDPDAFVRIHRSAMVRLGAVSELERIGGGDYLIRLHDATELTLSRSYRRTFEERIGRSL
ncbi:MAG: hypothetical protein CMJ18_23055 [Phycisphaeraceae bacterium]|nr:hypothetical protein [Phycisphaeraceae bacterium]